jgi:type IV pilus assembly protein PilC
MAAVAKKVRDDVKQYNFAWVGKDKTGKIIRRNARGRRCRRGRQPATPGHPGLLHQEGQAGRGQEDHGEGHHHLHPPAGGDDEGGRAAAAGVRHRRPRPRQPRGRQAPARHQDRRRRPGSSLGSAFRKYPRYFDALFCNLVTAGEAAGILDTLLDRLATYKEKILAIKGKIKSALFYPISIIVVAIVVTAVIMIFVIPVFKDLFKSFGADLPGPTQFVITISDGSWATGGGCCPASSAARGSSSIRGGPRPRCRSSWTAGAAPAGLRRRDPQGLDRALVPDPSTMFAAGVPLVEALDSVAGAAGNYVYYDATQKIRAEVSSGTALTMAMTNSNVFPSMVLQMVAIGEESGSLDGMLSKVADFFEQEVDERSTRSPP